MTGVFSAIDITKANVHDFAYLEDVKSQLSNAVLLGDKGYISNQQQLDLFQSANVRLKTPMRANQKNYKKQPFVFRKTRKRIETLFSQLCDQFMIRRNYAKSFDGFKTRILSKITALTSIQYINKYLFKRNINNIKIQITRFHPTSTIVQISATQNLRQSLCVLEIFSGYILTTQRIVIQISVTAVLKAESYRALEVREHV